MIEQGRFIPQSMGMVKTFVTGPFCYLDTLFLRTQADSNLIVTTVSLLLPSSDGQPLLLLPSSQIPVIRVTKTMGPTRLQC